MNKNPITFNETEFYIPDGYLKATWDEISKGDTVWVVGFQTLPTDDPMKYIRKPLAYGPYTVVDTEKKVLRNWQDIDIKIGDMDGVLVRG